jgi:selenocysteine-specific elongation factor
VGHVVYGTAGHIDHGKTSLVKALTGIDCDRLPEERDRGITIDLGFAWLDDDDVRLHFVDVPGHERLVHTMIAGASGIDLALLVVAADEGIMPQTLEHLEVIRLMGVPGGAVALTKIDLVEPDLIELAMEEVRELLAGTPFEHVPMVPVSASAGDGIDDLRRVLIEQALAVRPRQLVDRPYRQTVDRVFTLTGVGTVVTGTSLWGRLEVGSDVLLLPSNRRCRVRRLHVHGQERQVVEAGERVAANLVGVSHHELERGEQLLSPGPWAPTRLVTVDLEMLEGAPHGLDEGDELEVHAHAARVPARVDRLADRPLPPGSRSVAQLSLAQPLVVFPGDRVILRRPAPVNTFAGGQVLDARLPRWRRRDSHRLAGLPPVHKEAWPDLLGSWIDAAGLDAVTVDDLCGRLGVLPAALEASLGRLTSAGRITALPTQPRRLVATGALEGLAEAATREVAARLEGEMVSSGVPAGDFMHGLVPRAARGLSQVYVDLLRDCGAVAVVEGRVVPAGSDGFMTTEGARLVQSVERAYLDAGLEPPSPSEVAETLTARPASVEGICQFLLDRGQLVRLEGKFLIHRRVLDDVARRVAEWDVDRFTVGDFKERVGLTRKLAIPILEWLDGQRVTVRDGDARRVLRRPG